MNHITLHYKEGSSDKLYRASIDLAPDGYRVNFSYGRRGGTQMVGSKTASSVTLDTAQRIFGKLVREKLAKGYKPLSEFPKPHLLPPPDSKDSKIRCQLLGTASEEELEGLFTNELYWMQEKFDGRRLLLRKSGEQIAGINRRGMFVGITGTLAGAASAVRGDFLLDGELVGETLHCFDLLEFAGKDLRTEPYHERYLRLVHLLGLERGHIRFVDTMLTWNQKTALFNQLRDQGKEGVVFKHHQTPFVAGRGEAAGNGHLKFKFVETASFIVKAHNQKRSVQLMLADTGKGPFSPLHTRDVFQGKTSPFVDAGSVAIPQNETMPEVGSVVECRYLYALRESGSIYQPVYLGLREDISPAECTTAQLKYKPYQKTALAA